MSAAASVAATAGVAAAGVAGVAGCSASTADVETAERMHENVSTHTRQEVVDFLEGAARKYPQVSEWISVLWPWHALPGVVMVGILLAG
jgi:hypothetical protein